MESTIQTQSRQKISLWAMVIGILALVGGLGLPAAKGIYAIGVAVLAATVGIVFGILSITAKSKSRFAGVIGIVLSAATVGVVAYIVYRVINLKMHHG